MAATAPLPATRAGFAGSAAVAVRTRGADAVVQALVRLGARTFFGIPGGAISPVCDALLDVPEARVHVVRHEAEALFAACGHHFVTGSPAVVFVTSGPGLTNALTGLASAHCDGIPLVLLVGEVPRALQGRGALQDGSAHRLDVRSVVGSMCRACVEAPSASAIPSAVERLVSTATATPGGPVVLVLPLDVQTADCPPCSVARPRNAEVRFAERDVDAVAELLKPGRSAAILAGSGLRRGDGPAALLELATRYAAPVLTTPKAKGIFPESHPLAAGVHGIGGHPSAAAVLSGELDVLLALGTSLGDLATDGFSDRISAARALVQVDADGHAVGRTYPVDVAVLGPVAPFLRQLSARASGARAPLRGGSLAMATNPAMATDGPGGRISPARALWELQRVLPDDTLFAIDSGEHFLFATHYLRIDRPDAFLAQSGLGSMGSSFGAALGASLAQPGRRIAVIAGDGGFGMSGTQVADAVTVGAPITVCIFNDERLGMVELGHTRVYGRTPSYATPPIDIVGMARALGAEAERVEHTGEILALGDRLRSANGPLVLDVRIDPAVTMKKKDRIAALGNAP